LCAGFFVVPTTESMRMNPKITRRKTLAGLSSAILLPVFGSSCASQTSRPPAVFVHGVASGDPDHHSLVIWTRVSGFEATVSVEWELAEDADFSRLVSSGFQRTSAAQDYTLKVLVASLLPGRVYFYRFRVGQTYSTVGRTRTLPVGDLSSLTLAVVSCSNYPFGYFNVYEAIAKDPKVEWVLHLGDYIYEYPQDGWGADTGKALGREHVPAGETVSLSDYRQRHAQYKADEQSRMMHAAHPLLVIWDDHESANNPWMGGAQNHQSDTEGDWLARRDAALQAYYEWMPIRDPFPGQRATDYWRNWRFGNLASLITLETRHSGRAEQIELWAHARELTDPQRAEVFMRERVGAPNRPMLSDAMESFVHDSLCDAQQRGTPWKMLANQVPMARTLNPHLDPRDIESLEGEMAEQSYARLQEIARRGELGLPLYLDPWDGYPWAREAFYDVAKSCDVRDLLVLTGDSHSFWCNQLFDGSGETMGLELGTTGVTSPGDFLEFGARGARLLDESIIASNPEVRWTDGLHNGYLRLTLTPESAQADFQAVDSVLERRYMMQTIRSEKLLRDGSALTYWGERAD
jgi:alkaline phosphatase D